MYEDHYGLTGRPFQLTPDPRFWFDTATHKKAMAYLGYGLSQGEGFIVITGDIGAGKTTLVGHLTDTVDADRLNVIKIVSTQIAADDLLRTVCAGLGIDADGLTKAAMLASIERGLHVVARGGRRTLLIVDEAQALPVDSLEELRMLSNFQAGGHAMLQIFLLGQPEFRDKLHADGLDQLRQRVIAMHHLGPMEADELEAYLIHRLSICGWTGTPRFKTDALATIYAWSGGIPRRINNLVSRVLLYGAMEGVEVFTAAHVHAVADDLAVDGMTGAAPLGPLADAEAPELDLQPEMAIRTETVSPAPESPPAPDVDWPAASEVSATPEVEWPAATEAPPETDAEWPAAPAWNDWDEPVEADAVSIDAATPAPRPIHAEAPIEDAAPSPMPIVTDSAPPAPTPIVLNPPAPVAEDAPLEPLPTPEPQDEPVAMRPVEISTTPRLFDPVRLRGRRSILAPVDDATDSAESAPHVVPEPHPIVVAAPEPTVMEWPLQPPEPVNEPAAEPAPATAPAPVADLDLARRLAAIDKRMEEQDEALRRVLTLMVDWMEAGRGDAGELRGKLG